jgi:hypothetical protein
MFISSNFKICIIVHESRKVSVAWAFLNRYIRDPVPEPDTDSLKSLDQDAIYEM